MKLSESLGGVKVCLNLEECVSLRDTVDKAIKSAGLDVSLEVVVASDGVKSLNLDENTCDYSEIVVYRLVRGG